MRAKNRMGRCGFNVCEELYQGQCSKCVGYFCDLHMQERPHHTIEHGQRVARMGSLCEHCWERRDLGAVLTVLVDSRRPPLRRAMVGDRRAAAGALLWDRFEAALKVGDGFVFGEAR